jgi:MmyB-like transcription regulator ligand binding domain
LRPDWERSLAGTVAALRANVGPDIDDPWLTELVGDLSLRSKEFRQLWARHDVRPKGSGTTVMHAMFPATDPADGQALTACIDYVLENR